MNVNDLKKDHELVHVGSLGDDRELFRVPITRINTEEPFKSLRAKDPTDEKFKVIGRSVGERGIFYPPLVFAAETKSGIELQLVDGHQRLRAAKDRGDTELIVCIGTAWSSVTEAFRDGVSAQFARYAMQEGDVLSIAMTDQLTTNELVNLTGYSESKVRQLKTVADHRELAAIVQENLVAASRMSALIKACEDNPEKLRLLGNTFRLKADFARKEAKRWATKLKAERNKKWDRTARRKASADHYFASENWDAWTESLGDSNLAAQIKEESGITVLDLGGKSKLAIRIGDDEEWAERFAIYGFAEKKHDEVDIESLGQLIDDFPEFENRVKAIYARLVRQQTDARLNVEAPLPQRNPQVAEEELTDDEPVQQNVDHLQVDES